MASKANRFHNVASPIFEPLYWYLRQTGNGEVNLLTPKADRELSKGLEELKPVTELQLDSSD